MYFQLEIPEDLNKISYDELEVWNNKINAFQEEVSKAKRGLAKVMDAKILEKQAKEKLDKMSDSEKAAIAQLLSAPGIPSGEQVPNI